MTRLTGCFTALVTPMKAGNLLNAPIDYDVLKELIEYQIKGKVDGVLVSGCTGHSASLTEKEQAELFEKAVEFADGRVKVIIGDGSNCTRDAIRIAKKMEEVGAKIHLQISPYQNKPTQEGLYQHYAHIAKAISGDLIIYNVPGRTGKNVEAETTIRLAKEFSNIVAVKEASGNMVQIKKIIDETKELKHFSVLSGDDSLTLEVIKNGGYGIISVASNVDPARVSEMTRLALKGRFGEAGEINETLKGLYKVLFVEPNPIPAHCALRKLGIPVGIPRLPLTEATEETSEQINKCLEGLGLI